MCGGRTCVPITGRGTQQRGQSSRVLPESVERYVHEAVTEEVIVITVVSGGEVMREASWGEREHQDLATLLGVRRLTQVSVPGSRAYTCNCNTNSYQFYIPTCTDASECPAH